MPATTYVSLETAKNLEPLLTGSQCYREIGYDDILPYGTCWGHHKLEEGDRDVRFLQSPPHRKRRWLSWTDFWIHTREHSSHIQPALSRYSDKRGWSILREIEKDEADSSISAVGWRNYRQSRCWLLQRLWEGNEKPDRVGNCRLRDDIRNNSPTNTSLVHGPTDHIGTLTCMVRWAPTSMQRRRIAWQSRLNCLSPSRTAVASRIVSMEPSWFALEMWPRHHTIGDRKKQITISSRVILTKYLHFHQDSFEKTTRRTRRSGSFQNSNLTREKTAKSADFTRPSSSKTLSTIWHSRPRRNTSIYLRKFLVPEL